MKKRKWYWWLGLVFVVAQVFNIPFVMAVVLGGGTPEQLGASVGYFIGFCIGIWLLYKGRRSVK